MLRFIFQWALTSWRATDNRHCVPVGFLFLGELRLDTMPKGGPLGGGHETLEAELVIAKLERFAALGDILLLGG